MNKETSFKGDHYVECNIVVNNECISYDRLPVKIIRLVSCIK